MQDWTNHIYIENEELDGNELTLEVYEWNWVTYDDGNGGESDVMGFATIHEMVLKKDEDGIYQIVADNYDESDILGEKDITFTELMEEVGEEQEVELSDAQEAAAVNMTDLLATTSSSTSSTTNTSGYHPIDAIIYADQYVNHSADGTYGYCGNYNSSYTSYATPTKPTTNSGGNDCANYVSQCLKAGGMVNDTSSDSVGWWYNSSTNTCSESWSGTLSMQTYWVTEKGYSKVAASATTIYPGNPVIGSNEGHVGICVGYNTSGVPIINAHTKDQYHVPYTSGWVEYTIQIAGKSSYRAAPSSATTINVTSTTTTKSVTIHQDQWIWYKVVIDGSSTYTFSGTSASGSESFCAGMYIYRAISSSNGNIYMDEVKKVVGSSITTTNFSTTITKSDTVITAGTYYIQLRALNSAFGSGTIQFSYRKS